MTGNPAATLTREDLLAMLERFARQRPGLDWRNYGDVRTYRSEARKIARDLSDVVHLLNAVRATPDIATEDLMRALESNNWGRLSLETAKDGAPYLTYCAGQYWPVEYRRAVANVLASVLWGRALAVIRSTYGKERVAEWRDGKLSTLAYKDMCSLLGRGVASRYFFH